MSDKERAKEYIDWLSPNELNHALYFLNLMTSKRSLYEKYINSQYILTEFEKWLWEKLNIKPANKIYVGECLEKLQELKGENDNGRK